MNTWCARLLIASLVSASTACTSVPIRYYTLSPPTEKATGAAGAIPRIEFRMVNIPPQLNRADLLVRTGPAQITLLDNERWASPLKDEIKEALRLDLQQRLARAASSSRALTTLTLDIDVHRFEAELGRYAHFEASWGATVTGEGIPTAGEKVANCVFQAEEDIPSGYAGMVEGYQRAIAALADAIAATLTRSTSGREASCGTPIRD